MSSSWVQIKLHPKNQSCFVLFCVVGWFVATSEILIICREQDLLCLDNAEIGRDLVEQKICKQKCIG
jgi:hypothetical protein